jgi:hypothetical protein
MKKYISLHFVIFILALGLLSGCFEPPEFSEVPQISFKSLRFVEVNQAPDSLVLSFDFQDGDGDVGLSSEMVYPPYHSFNIVLDADTNLVFYQDDQVTPPLSLFDNFDGSYQGLYSDEVNLPPFNCEDYLILDDPTADSASNDRTDTVLIQKNKFNRNIYIDFLRKRNGQYENINRLFSQGTCQEFFNSRVPIFDRNNVGRSLSGTISFAMLSQGFRTVFSNDSIKIRFYIYDQELNQSNIEESNDFILSDIALN